MRADKGLTRRHKKEFLENYLEGRYICVAAKKTGINDGTVWLWRRDDAEFRKAFDEARILVEQRIVAKLEAEADRRGVVGTVKPIFQGGQQVGAVREYSDTLLIFRLKGLAPDRYKDRQEQEHKGKIIFEVKDDRNEIGATSGY